MTTLNLELFTSAVADLEQAQYKIMGGLQRVRQAFAGNQIYPHLGELIELHTTLRTIMQRSEDLEGALPGRVTGVDLENEKVRYEWPELDRGEMADVKHLIAWTLPKIQDAIEEGRTIFEFVDENMRLEEVGLVPSYTQEGYLIVPDQEASAWHILQYSLSIFTGADEEYRSLRTAHVKSLAHGRVQPSPRDVKLNLVAERRELPNPATYFFDTDLDFPYEPTMFPVAKRKFMRHLFQQGGGRA